jgi:hypothetical protein
MLSILEEEDARDSGADERRRESDEDGWEVRPDPVAVVCLLLAVYRNHNRDLEET